MCLDEIIIRQVSEGKQLFAILLTQYFNLFHRKSTTGKGISFRTKQALSNFLDRITARRRKGIFVVPLVFIKF